MTTRESMLAVALLVCAAIGGLVYLLDDVSGTPARPELASQQQVILDASRNKAADADLSLLFDELNARHFSAGLPNVKVLFEDLDPLNAGEYRQNGMTDGTTVLLNAALEDDDDEVRRTLCHEMVHVKFFAAGQKSTAHDDPFQNELRRIFDDGCFEAIWATEEEKASLGEWIQSERTRLDLAHAQTDAQAVWIRQETDRIERMFAELNERIARANAAGSGWPTPEESQTAERQRSALNDSILTYNTAVAANERDRALFNDAVQRQNLMLAYPDGLAEDRAKGLIR
ncbi:MAG: SprT-like domain-containing protein [Vicinamibacterales bacterium]